MKKLSFLAVLLLLFSVGCTDQMLSSEEAAPGEEIEILDLENYNSEEFQSEEEIRAQYPSDLEFEILLPTADATERASKDGSIFVQVIHNSPSYLAYFVDVYVNGDKVLNNFRFRSATPYLELPADTDLEIAIAPFWSRNARRSLYTMTYNLPEGDYVLVAGGVLRENRFNRNPDGLDVGFDLFPAAGRMGADSGSGVDILAFHGATDAPTVDVVARGVGTLVDDFSFGEYQGYVNVPAGPYTLDVTTSDQSAVAASFGVDLTGLDGGAAVVLASGYLTPPGFRFRLIAVLPDGTVIRLPSAR